MGHGTAGVVLAGGRSSRMGQPKAELEWHGSTLLRRTLGVLARSVDGPLLVVRAAGQPLPQLPAQVEIVEDPEQGLGPLQGIAAGLAALAGRAQAAFVCSTDLPFLHPAFVRRVLSALTDEFDVVHAQLLEPENGRGAHAYFILCAAVRPPRATRRRCNGLLREFPKRAG